MKLFKKEIHLWKKKKSTDETEITVKAEKPREKRKLSLFSKIAMIVFAAFVIISVFNMQTQISSLQKEEKQLTEQIDQYTAQVEELKADLQTPFDDAYVIKVAREKLGYYMPDEIIFYNDISN